MSDIPECKRFGILYVDDEVQSLKYFRRLFEKKFQIFTAENATVALEIIGDRLNDIAIILADQRMPGETGVDFLAKAKILNPTIVRILVTAFAEFDSIVDAISCARVSRYIQKPWDIQELESIIEEALQEYLVESERAVLRTANNSNIIIRAIEFPAEYHQSGMEILSYFGKILRDKYPDYPVKIRIEQVGLKVTMAIETPTGQKEEIEETLQNYGLVVTGRMSPNMFFGSDKELAEFMIKLESANVHITAQHHTIETAKSKIRDYEQQLALRDRYIAEMTVMRFEKRRASGLKNLTILFLDLVEFGKMDDEEKVEKVEILRRIAAPFLDIHDGMYINTWGDGIIAGFESPKDGVTCACKFSRHLNAEGVRARIGMNLGLATVRYNPLTDRMDIDGNTVDIAARLEPVAKSGEVLVSKDLRFHPEVFAGGFTFCKCDRKLVKPAGKYGAEGLIECYSVTLKDP